MSSSFATAVEVVGIAFVMYLLKFAWSVYGAVAAATAMFAGRFAAAVYMVPSVFKGEKNLPASIALNPVTDQP